MSQLKNLEVLDISDNNFKAGLPEGITSAVSLRNLDISSCSLSSLPLRYHIGCIIHFHTYLFRLRNGLNNLNVIY